MASITLPKIEQFDTLLHHDHVSDLMATPLIVLTKDSMMADAKVTMRDHRISGIPIVDDEGHLVGLITVENIIICLEQNRMGDRIEDHMVKDVVSLKSDMSVNTVVEFLMGYSFGRFPVIDEKNMVVGVVTNEDLMVHILKRLGTVYLHDKRRDEILMPSKYLLNSEMDSNDECFTYNIDTSDIERAGEGSQLFKKYISDRGMPSELIRRASIATYEAEVNVVIHAYGKGLIKAHIQDDQLFIMVSDSGPGIENIELAVEPGYSTATEAIREKGWGAGMGLANIKKFTDKVIIQSSEKGVKLEMVLISTKEEKGDP